VRFLGELVLSALKAAVESELQEAHCSDASRRRGLGPMITPIPLDRRWWRRRWRRRRNVWDAEDWWWWWWWGLDWGRSRRWRWRWRWWRWWRTPAGVAGHGAKRSCSLAPLPSTPTDVPFGGLLASAEPLVASVHGVPKLYVVEASQSSWRWRRWWWAGTKAASEWTVLHRPLVFFWGPIRSPGLLIRTAVALALCTFASSGIDCIPHDFVVLTTYDGFHILVGCVVLRSELTLHGSLH